MRKRVGIFILLGFLFLTHIASAFYDANVGRWLNRDPLGEQDGSNLYRFVGNNAITWIDPDGRKRMTCAEVGTCIHDNDQCDDPKIDEPLLKCLAYRESAFDPEAKNKSGAIGLMQVMDGAVIDTGNNFSNLTDPGKNIRIGSKYLCMLLKRTKGNLDDALKRYSGDRSGKYGNAVKDCADCLRKNMSGPGKRNDPCDQKCLDKAKANPTP